MHNIFSSLLHIDYGDRSISSHYEAKYLVSIPAHLSIGIDLKIQSFKFYRTESDKC